MTNSTCVDFCLRFVYTGSMEFTKASPELQAEIDRLKTLHLKEMESQQAQARRQAPASQPTAASQDDDETPLDQSLQVPHQQAFTAHQERILERWRVTFNTRSWHILEYLSRQSTPVPARAISRTLGLERTTTSTYLTRLMRSGHIWKPARGVYRLNPAAFPAAPFNQLQGHCGTCTCIE